MRKYVKVDQTIVDLFKKAGLENLLETKRTIEKADFTTEFSKENLEKAIKNYDIVVVQGNKLNGYKNRVGKEFKVYFRTLPKESEKTEAVKKKKKEPGKTEAALPKGSEKTEAVKKKKKEPGKTEAVKKKK